MRDTLPISNTVLGFANLLGVSPPADRLSLIRGISKNSLLLELSGLNFRLRGKFAKEIKSDPSTQQAELFYFCAKNPTLYNKYVAAANRFTNGNKTNLFSRPSCTFAIEEIIQSDIPEIEGFTLSKISEWEAILQYILAVNEHITKYERQFNSEVTFESLNPHLIPISEMLLVPDPLYTLHRGLMLMNYLAAHNDTKIALSTYISQTYRTNYEEFIKMLYRLYFSNDHKDANLNFYYMVSDNDPHKYVFDILSQRMSIKEVITLLDIKKYPFYKNGTGHYILTDNILLLDKIYQQFINDFWYDHLAVEDNSNQKSFSFQDYKAIIGRFFEGYVEGLLRKSFAGQSGFVLKTLDQLKVRIKKQQSDFADLYIRQDGKVLVGEIKSTSIYDDEKYGRNIEALYRNDRDKFFKKFGVDQLVSYIRNLKSDLTEIDPGLIEQKKIRVWPVIIFNEKAFQTPMMAPVFNKRFKELLGNKKMPEVYVYPLTIMHVGDVEQMHITLKKEPGRIWQLLTNGFWKAKFIPPFYITLNRSHIKHDYSTVRERFAGLVD